MKRYYSHLKRNIARYIRNTYTQFYIYLYTYAPKYTYTYIYTYIYLYIYNYTYIFMYAAHAYSVCLKAGLLKFSSTIATWRVLHAIPGFKVCCGSFPVAKPSCDKS